MEKNLADLQAQVLKHREQLTFYRGIVSPEDGIGGLRIQRFQVLSGGAPSITIDCGWCWSSRCGRRRSFRDPSSCRSKACATIVRCS